MTFPGLGETARHRAADQLRGLYVIIDPQLTANRDPLWVAEQALEGGATALQLRDKVGLKGETLPLAQRMVRLCRDHDAVCIINDHADLAVAAGAHGVHVGQRDLPVAMARAVLKPWQLVGSSNALEEEAVASYEAGADYIAVGAMFPSGSKSDTRPAGLETMRQVRQALFPKGEPSTEPGLPLVAIGGITRENVGEVAKAGADGICVISAVTMAEDPLGAARELLAAFRAAQA